MDKKKDYAKKGIAFCQMIKDGINGLCQMMDITNDTFNENDRLGDYKGIFSKVSAWENEHANYLNNSQEEI